MKDIDLKDIDWNHLNPNEFQQIEKDLQEKHKLLKSSQKKEKRNTGYVFVTLRGNQYQIKEVIYNRLKTLKSEKSKEKLINEIISTVNPVENL